MRTLSFAVRTERPPDSVIPDVQAAIRRIDPRLAVSQVRTMNQIVDEALSQQRAWARCSSAASRSARCCWRRWDCSASCPAR